MEEQTKWKVILIDDEQDIRDVCSLAIEDAGYQVHSASDGEAGIRLIESIRPQIVVTDVKMPGKLDGMDVLETVKRQFPETEVIVVTAFGDMNLAIRALQADASDFVTKPISDQALRVALNRARNRYLSRSRLTHYLALLEQENAQTAQQLKISLDYRKNLVEGSTDGILGLNSAGFVVEFNKSMESLSGYRKDQALDTMRLEDFLSEGEISRLLAAIDTKDLGGKDRLFLFESSLIRKDAQNVPVQISAFRMYEDTEYAGLVCFFSDLQKLRRMEQKMADQAHLLHQDKMMSLGRLAASVVHEINNPLSGVLNYLRLMARMITEGKSFLQSGEKFYRYLTLCETEIDRCSNIVGNLLSFSRRSENFFSKVSVADLVRRCESLSSHRMVLSGIRMTCRVREDIPEITGDFNQLQQCLLNLIFNAADAMPQGGVLSVAADWDQKNNLATITVSDTGSGIDEKDMPYIFEPFFSTKQGEHGVGLGLSIVFGIMDRHKGAVTVSNREEGGASFVLEFAV